MPTMVSTGASATIVHVCDERSTAISLGSGDVPVLGTPKVVALAEEAAVAAIAGALEPGTTTVGTHVDIAHVAPTPIGGTVRATAVVTEVDRRRIGFSIEVVDGDTVVAQGSHRRAVVDRRRFVDALGG